MWYTIPVFRNTNPINERDLTMKKDNSSLLKSIFVAIGALVSIAALVVVVYTVFKKYFKVTFECDDCCDECEDECFADEDEEFEPICCCEEDEMICDCDACDCEVVEE